MLSPQDKNIRLKQVYTELDRKYEEEEAQRKAQKQSIAYINLYGFPVDHSALICIPKETAEKYQAVVFFKEVRNLKIGLVDTTPATTQLIDRLTKQDYFVEAYLISRSSFNHFLSEYASTVSAHYKKEEIIIEKDSPWTKPTSLKDLSARLTNASTTELMEAMLGSSLGMDASDIHMEPETNGLKIRYRIDGVLQDVTVLAISMHHPIVSRIKIMSKLKLNITNVPQDGSFSLTFNQSHVDVRVSILPSAFGESIVMRILRQDKGSVKFEDLGIIGLARERLLKELEKPNGMVLTTGPTGSGKTTTLYAILNRLNEPGVKIITLEDPVEYKIEGITQTPIDAKAGLTFAAGLRAILRQDPDVVMIGEMRDLETAETASQAALTGHVVLSTMHTNDAAGAIPRLLDLGVKPFVLAPAINAIIAQRLVRKICEFCKTIYKPSDVIRQRVELILKSIPKNSKTDIPSTLTFQHSPGCKKCKGLGYKGRLGIYEIFTINDAIEKLILKQTTTTEVKNQTIADGMITMMQDGILKALQGMTDVEEVFRVVEE